MGIGGGAGYSLSKMTLNSSAEVKFSGFVGVALFKLGYEFWLTQSMSLAVFVAGQYIIDAGYDSSTATAFKISGAQTANSLNVTPGLAFSFKF